MDTLAHHHHPSLVRTAAGAKTAVAAALSALAAAALLGACSTGAPPHRSAQPVSVTTSPPAAGYRSLSGPMPLPSGSPVAPDLAALLPASVHISNETWVRLAAGAPQVVVTYSQAESASPTGSATDLVLYAWDSFAKRWVNIFDAARAPDPQPTGTAYPGATILPTQAAVEGLAYAPIVSAPGRVDLAFWAGVNFGANAPFDEYILHYDGQSAQIVYSTNADGGQASVTGTAPDQQLSMTAEWVDGVDPMSSPIRNYTQAVAWRPGPDGAGDSSYQIVGDTRSWLGVYLATATPAPGSAAARAAANGQPASEPTVVMDVVPGSPADGLIHPGDQLLAVAGVTVPAGHATFTPSVVDQVASEPPGAAVALSVERSGVQLTVNVTLGSYASPPAQSSIAPTPAFLGVEEDATPPAGSPTGVYLSAVVPGGGAAGANLGPGDVIVSFASSPVTEPTDLTTALLACPSGSVRQLGYIDTAGTAHTVDVTLGSYSGSYSTYAPVVHEV